MIVYSSMAWQPESYARGGTGGGPATFMGYLCEYLHAHGHQTTNDPTADYSLHFANVMAGRGLLRSLHRGVPIVLRLDNIPSAPHLSKFWQVYVKPAVLSHHMSHTTVYISEYCQAAWAFASGGTMAGRSVVIHNGARSDTFFSIDNEPSRSVAPTILLHEHLRRDDGGLRTALAAFVFVKREIPEARLMLAGKLSGRIPDIVKGFLSEASAPVKDSIVIAGSTDHSMLPDLIRGAGVFVHPVANSACSHTVPEVLSCGVPVVCYSGTGPAELVGESGFVLPSEYEGVRHGFERFPREDPKQLADAICAILGNQEAYRNAAHARAHLFSSDVTCKKYLGVFEEAISNPANAPSMRKAAWLYAQFMIARVFSTLFSSLESFPVPTTALRKCCSKGRSLR